MKLSTLPPLIVDIHTIFMVSSMRYKMIITAMQNIRNRSTTEESVGVKPISWRHDQQRKKSRRERMNV